MAAHLKSAETRPHRLHALCPYFAMFPSSFVRNQILLHTNPGDLVLDPFSGRGTTLLEALILRRRAVAFDVNPVAACVTAAKGNVPPLVEVRKRISDLDYQYKNAGISDLNEESASLPAFFAQAFHKATLRELLFLRRRLNWRAGPLDCYIAALALGSLHGEMDRSPAYFSNQMPRTISPKPAYSLRFWEKHGLKAKRKHVFDLLNQRAVFRMQDGRPEGSTTTVMADARLASRVIPSYIGKVGAIITSPPYLNVTSFEEDQWLRLWFLGGAPRPTYSEISKDDRHTSPQRYWRFLADVWHGVAPLLTDSATIVCRIGGNSATVNSIASNLIGTVRGALPNWSIHGEPEVSLIKRRQTDSFRPGSEGCKFEVDLVMRASN